MADRRYSKAVVAALFKLSSGNCYWPRCTQPIVAIVDNEPSFNFQIAHIRGLKPGSARYEDGMTDEERNSFTGRGAARRRGHRARHRRRPGRGQLPAARPAPVDTGHRSRHEPGPAPRRRHRRLPHLARRPRLMGALTGLVLGAAQAIALPRRTHRRWIWAPRCPCCGPWAGPRPRWAGSPSTSSSPSSAPTAQSHSPPCPGCCSTDSYPTQPIPSQEMPRQERPSRTGLTHPARRRHDPLPPPHAWNRRDRAEHPQPAAPRGRDPSTGQPLRPPTGARHCEDHPWWRPRAPRHAPATDAAGDRGTGQPRDREGEEAGGPDQPAAQEGRQGHSGAGNHPRCSI